MNTSDTNLLECNPGCGEAKKYKCKDGYEYGNYGFCVSPCKSGYTINYTPTCNGKTASDYYLREDKHSYCVKCGTLTCASGTYASKKECEKHLNYATACNGIKYNHVCYTNSSGCWAQKRNDPNMACVKCSSGICSLDYSGPGGITLPTLYINACIRNSSTQSYAYKYSSKSSISYPTSGSVNGLSYGVINCSVTKSSNGGDNCSSSALSQGQSTCSNYLML